MNIAFVIPYFYPAWDYGGSPRAAYNLAVALIERGHRVRVLTTDSAGKRRVSAGELAEVGALEAEGLEAVYGANLSNYLAYRHRVFLPIPLLWGMRARLEGVDLVHVHEYRSTLTVVALNAARGLDLPVVLSPHGGLKRLGKPRLKAAFDRIWGERILKQVRGVLAVSPVEEREAREAGIPPSRVFPLPNGISVGEYEDLPDRGSFNRRSGIQSRFLLFLGRLHWIKGIDILIDAFRRIRPDRPELALVVAGPDDGFGLEVRRRTRDMPDAVFLTGTLDHLRKREALVGSELLVVPSRHEMFPVTVLEALACGTPVLASSACGLPPLFGESSGVYGFATGDAVDLAAGLRRALDNAAASRASALRGSVLVRERFSMPAVAGIAEGIYSETSRSSA